MIMNIWMQWNIIYSGGVEDDDEYMDVVEYIYIYIIGGVEDDDEYMDVVEYIYIYYLVEGWKTMMNIWMQ